MKDWHNQWTLMLEPWQQRYRELAVREQRILLAAAILLPVILVIFGLWLPLQDRHAELQHQLIKAQQQADEALALARVLQASVGKAGDRKQPSGSLLSRVDALISELQLRQAVKQLRPQASMDGKQRIRVSFNPILWEKAAEFLKVVEERGMHPEQMKLEREKSGYVTLQVLVGISS